LKALSAEAGDKKIHFPFLTYGWATKDEALQALALESTQGKQTYHKVVIEVSGAKALKFVDCRMVSHRLNGAITSAGDAVDGINHFTLAATVLPEKTHADWVKEVAAAAAAAKDNKAPEAAPAEMMGGDMMAPAMMDPPAEM
jgi:hypothetical protein